MAPTSEPKPTGSIPCQPEDSRDPGQPQMQPFGHGPGSRLPGHKEVAAARVTWQRLWVDCWRRGGLFLQAVWGQQDEEPGQEHPRQELFFLGRRTLWSKGKDTHSQQLKCPKGSLTDLELHGNLWNAKPVTIHPQVFLLPVALASHVSPSPQLSVL